MEVVDEEREFIAESIYYMEEVIKMLRPLFEFSPGLTIHKFGPSLLALNLALKAE